MAGAMISVSSEPRTPPSPACGFRAREVDAEVAAERAVEHAEMFEDALAGDGGGDTGQWEMGCDKGHADGFGA